jgi:hypothetical protein
MRQDKVKDQCFKCSTPNWKLGHKCKDKKFFHCKIGKSDSDKDEEERDTSSSNEETNNEDSRNPHELGNQNTNPTLSVAAMMGIS